MLFTSKHWQKIQHCFQVFQIVDLSPKFNFPILDSMKIKTIY